MNKRIAFVIILTWFNTSFLSASELREFGSTTFTISLYSILFLDQREKPIQGKLEVVLKNKDTHEADVSRGGRATVPHKCEDILAFYFKPERYLIYNEYRQESLACTENPKTAIISFKQFADLTNRILNINDNFTISTQNEIASKYQSLQEAVLAGNIAASAFHANEIAATSRKSGNLDLERLMSEYAIRAGISLLTNVERSDEFVRFDPLQGRSVTTEEGIRILSEYQRSNNLTQSKSWDFETFDYIKRIESTEPQWQEFLAEQPSPMEPGG